MFQKYKNPEKSYRDHSIFLKTRDRYSSLFKLRRNNYVGWSIGLKKAGYATDPAYADKLISLIERYELWKLDGSKKPLNFRKEKKNIKKNNSISKIKESKNLEDVYIVKKGDTLYSISKKLGISVKNLVNINNISGNSLNIGQVLKLK